MPTIPDHLDALERLTPRDVFDLDDGTINRDEYCVVAETLDENARQQVLLVNESFPQYASALLTRWEALYQLRARGWTLAQRAARLMARVRFIPDFTPATIETRVEQYTGIDVTLAEPGGFRCDHALSRCDHPDDLIDGVFVFVIDMDWAVATAAGVRRADLLVFLEDLKPAHTVPIIRCDDFHCDDALSVCDRDLLGA